MEFKVQRCARVSGAFSYRAPMTPTYTPVLPSNQRVTNHYTRPDAQGRQHGHLLFIARFDESPVMTGMSS